VPANVGLAGNAFKDLWQGLLDGIDGDKAAEGRVYINVDAGIAREGEQQVGQGDILGHHGVQFGFRLSLRSRHERRGCDDAGNLADRSGGDVGRGEMASLYAGIFGQDSSTSGQCQGRAENKTQAVHLRRYPAVVVGLM
jgi:hypothetical protein